MILAGDIGGTNTKFGAVDREGRLHAQGSLRTTDHKTLDGFDFLHDSVAVGRAGEDRQ